MDPLLEQELTARPAARLSRQGLWFLLHAVVALAAWFGLMLIGYAVHPAGVPQWAILAASLAVPLVIGLIVARFHSDDMATTVWLLGLIWMMMVSLWILDMPTGPGRCFQCSATEKLTRTFLSIPRPSGLIDDDGPFIGTWPSVALIGYSIGALLGKRRG